MKTIKKNPKRIKKGKLVKILAQISMILVILLITTSVHAGNKDSTLIRNQVDGVYAIAPLKDKTHLYNLEMYTVNGKTAYCIEIGKKITSTTYNSTTEEIEQQRISKLTKKDLDYIKLISYFGYNYPKDQNHNKKEYYMAAQELIWEYLNDIDITWTNELDINGNKINIDSYKNEILNLMKKYTEDLNIANYYNLYVGQSLNISNDKISYYKVKNTEHEQINISNNKAVITASNTFIGDDKITFIWDNSYNYKPAIYNFEDSQTLLSVGELEEKEKTTTIKISGYPLDINLIDKDTKKCMATGQASLVGAIYGIYDDSDNLITTITTNNTCQNQISNLYNKIYYIRQIKPSKGYKKNTETKTFTMNMYRKITIEEEVIKNTIEINKLYEINDNYEKEEGIVFNIYDNNNEIYTSITTTKTGIDKITLPYGIYTIKQNNTTYGYEKVNNIKIDIHDDSNPIIRYDLLDKKITTKIHIKTKDKHNNTNITQSNIKYKIKDKDKNKYLSYIDINNKQTFEFSTDNSGEITIPIKLSYGNYQIEQITTPNKYLENTNPINTTINDKSTYIYIDNEVVVNIDFFNIPITGKLNITTKKETLTDNNKITETIKPNSNIDLYYENNLINKYTTNEEGFVTIDKLHLGNYCIIEKDTNNKKCIEIINKDNKTEIIEKNIELLEQIHKINLIITNIDENDNRIKDSIIELYKDNKIINTYITDNTGTININNLPIGKYCLNQKKVLPKYILNKDNICFEINNNSKDMNLIIKNKLNITKRIKIPNTLSNINYYIYIIPILIITIGAIINYQKKLFNN